MVPTISHGERRVLTEEDLAAHRQYRHLVDEVCSPRIQDIPEDLAGLNAAALHVVARGAIYPRWFPEMVGSNQGINVDCVWFALLPDGTTRYGFINEMSVEGLVADWGTPEEVHDAKFIVILKAVDSTFRQQIDRAE